jgi:5-methylcytosine-specific restriction endonuclease McrA
MARDYRQEYDRYQGTPEQRKKNNARKRARYAMEKAGRVREGDGKDVDHKKPIAKGGGNGLGNLRVTTPSKNRSFKRTKNAGMK